MNRVNDELVWIQYRSEQDEEKQNCISNSNLETNHKRYYTQRNVHWWKKSDLFIL